MSSPEAEISNAFCNDLDSRSFLHAVMSNESYQYTYQIKTDSNTNNKCVLRRYEPQPQRVDPATRMCDDTEEHSMPCFMHGPRYADCMAD